MYPKNKADLEVVENNLTHHSPKGDQVERYLAIRGQGKTMAELLLECCPPSRERSVAMTKLEEMVMWANAAIARNE